MWEIMIRPVHQPGVREVAPFFERAGDVLGQEMRVNADFRARPPLYFAPPRLPGLSEFTPLVKAALLGRMAVDVAHVVFGLMGRGPSAPAILNQPA